MNLSFLLLWSCSVLVRKGAAEVSEGGGEKVCGLETRCSRDLMPVMEKNLGDM